MSTRKKQIVLTQPERKGKPVKLRLDARTVVMVKNAKALAFWKQRYPLAQVIEEQGIAAPVPKRGSTTVKKSRAKKA
ncbi:MAG: hypothetical protein JSU02_00510 [Bacteroidetes bacterium]|nr:hypothetical protein [Bacteroidota bacterium]